ncbi:GNAT family N-acetyltransferase [Anaerorhabdus furcosa]|uniref:Predicted acetyltransferase n=1 Tax=Anaerorhabdus furcosa TaxID=118967 RepID=A0A1T4PRV5_9FIRM|nr:GNAT family N-acetyltransferase [Anaerorhabdus furcosa]SJZ93976.1 Predicted acetyltransferase [Anaerorhabdus furcosa]
MNKCCLVKPNSTDENAIHNLMERWKIFGGRMNPGLLWHFDGNYFEWLRYLTNWENGIDIGEEVPQTLFLLKRDDGAILGAVSIRHYLNHTNIIDGGHLGYGICPEFRGFGYGDIILKLALKKLLEMGIEKVLVTCDFDNYASQKVILNNGGVLENQALDEDGITVNRYWIDNTK